MNETLTAERCKAAAELGRKAFEAGKMAIPALDPELMKLLKGFNIGDGGVEVITAWADAWHKANIEAPVVYSDGKTEQDRCDEEHDRHYVRNSGWKDGYSPAAQKAMGWV